jgi:CubicO group peptidase (beta-lactamase class C family)
MRMLCLAVLTFLTGCATMTPSSPLQTFLHRAGALGFDGQVLVEKHGQLLADGAYGFADREHGVRNDRDTVFGIASQTKQFTAAAILILEERGALRVEDTIAKFLANVPDDKRDITLHQLMTHTSGLMQGDIVPDFADVTPEELVRKILASERKPPGTFRYSNAGYTLVAAIIERASGKPYATFLREEIFKPAGMHHTGVIGVDVPRKAAVAYRGLIPQGSAKTWKSNWRTWGGGDVFSTARDLYKWELVLRKGRFAKMFEPYVKLPDSEDQYGYGWFTSPKLIEHGGDTEKGYHCAFRRYLADGVTLIITGNRTEVNGMWQRWAIQDAIAAIALGEEYKQLPEIGRSGARVFARLGRAGGAHHSYRAADGGEVSVRRDGKQVVVEALTPAGVSLLWGTPRFTNAEEKTRALLDAAKSDPRAAFAIALTADADKYTGDYVEEWESLIHEHGDFLGYRIAGVVPRREAARAFVELQFAQGMVPIAYAWSEKGEGRLAGSTPGDGPPLARVFAPAPGGRFLACNFASRLVVMMDVPAPDRLVIGGVAFLYNPPPRGVQHATRGSSRHGEGEKGK